MSVGPDKGMASRWETRCLLLELWTNKDSRLQDLSMVTSRKSQEWAICSGSRALLLTILKANLSNEVEAILPVPCMDSRHFRHGYDPALLRSAGSWSHSHYRLHSPNLTSTREI